MKDLQLVDKLTTHIANQFDLIKDKYGLTYEKDFQAFSIGYTLGVVGTLRSLNKKEELK